MQLRIDMRHGQWTWTYDMDSTFWALQRAGHRLHLLLERPHCRLHIVPPSSQTVDFVAELQNEYNLYYISNTL